MVLKRSKIDRKVEYSPYLLTKEDSNGIKFKTGKHQHKKKVLEGAKLQ